MKFEQVYKDFMKNPALHPIALSVVVFLITMLVLSLVKPKLIKVKDVNTGQMRNCYLRAFLYSALLASTVGLVFSMAINK